jgi:SNF2 family DNA or RNA helicase
MVIIIKGGGINMAVSIRLGGPTKITGNESLYLSFSYDPHVVSIVQKFPKRWFHGDSKEWEIPATDFHLVKKGLKKYSFVYANTTEKELEKKSVTTLKFDSSIFKTTPYPYQLEGIEFGLSHDAFLLGDEQGLGKSLQVINLAILRKKEMNHCLIVCGINGLKYNWLEEIAKHSNENAKIIGSKINRKGKLVEGSVKERLEDLETLPDAFFLITNIETLRNDDIRDKLSSLIKKKEIGMVAIDEAHAIKNGRSKQGKAIRWLHPKYKVAMTGTPLINKPVDLYNIMNWLGAIHYHKETYHDFKHRYCYVDRFGSIIGYKNKQELAGRLQNIMIRRKKADVLHLPEKIHTTSYIELAGEQLSLYEKTKKGILERFDQTGKKENEKKIENPLELINRLRQLTTYPQLFHPTLKSNAKLTRVYELIEEKIENDEKLIVYSHWKEPITALKNLVHTYNPAIVTGDIDSSKRQLEVKKFQEDDSCRVILGTIDALGTGFTLTAAQTVIFLDNPWTSAKKMQAEDRAHRIGTKKSVNIITMVAKNTIDEKVVSLLNEKKQLAEDIVDSSKDEQIFGKLDKEKIKWLLS